MDEPSIKGTRGTPLDRLVADVGFRRALRQAARESISDFRYLDTVQADSTTDLVFAPTGSLDPFHLEWVCTTPACLADRATRLARLMALYSDFAIVPDSITETVAVCDLRRRATREELVQKLEVLRILRPLVVAGVLRFGTPHAVLCPECDPGLDERLTEFITETSDDWLRHATTSDDGAKRTVDLTAVLHLPGAGWKAIVAAPTADERAHGTRAAVRRLVREFVTRLFINCRSAMHRSALVLSGQSLETATVARLASAVTKRRPPQDFSSLATLDLPWVSTLEVREVLALRETAARALPRLRERLAHRLQRDSTTKERAAAEAIQELRVEAEEVRAELHALSSRNERLFEGLFGGLALSLSVGGVATGMVPAGLAVGGLLSALGTIHTAHSRRSAAEASLMGKPAYALVAARDLLESRDHRMGGAV